MLTLNIAKRDASKKHPAPHKIESLTESIPGVFYSKKEKSTPITVTYSDFKKVWKEAGGSSLITLKGVGEDKEVVIQDIHLNPVTDDPRHVDFYVIERGKVMEAEIPLEFIGVAPAVKELSGVLVKPLHTIKIEVLPKDLPQNIEVDVSSLEDFDARILAKDLKLPESANLLDDAEEVVALVSEAVEEPEEEPEKVDIADIEIEQKGKVEEEPSSDANPVEKV